MPKIEKDRGEVVSHDLLHEMKLTSCQRTLRAMRLMKCDNYRG
jgi:hypothetical protein